MRKETTAIKYGDPVPEKPRGGSITVSYHELLKRVQRKLGEQGRWAMSTEGPRGHWSEAPQYISFEIELRDRGEVRLIPDLEEFARGLGVLEDCERGFPESDFRSAT